MSGNLKRKQPEDTKKININQKWELEYWSKEMGISKERLKQAVKGVGPSIVLVKAHLRLSMTGKSKGW